MQAKITEINPIGDNELSVEFTLPLIHPSHSVHFENNKIIIEESMKKNRYLLEIGEFKYWINENGEIKNINNEQS